jgi:hypothetical protein
MFRDAAHLVLVARSLHPRWRPRNPHSSQPIDWGGVGYRSFTKPYLDSCGIFKEAVISILATIAKQERIRLSERVQAGLARPQSGKAARPAKKIVDASRIAHLRSQGHSMARNQGVTMYFLRLSPQSMPIRQLTFQLLKKGFCAAHAFSETVNSLITGLTGIKPTSRSLVSRAIKCVPSSGATAMNFSPSPAPDFACCTVAFALICPSWTRKSSLIVAPTARGSSVSRNKPFVLRSRTRETSSCPLQRQHTQTSSPVLARELSLLAYAGCCNDFMKYPLLCESDPAP